VYEDEGQSFEDVGVWIPSRASVMGSEGPQEFSDVMVTDGVLRALRVPPVLGRTFTFEDTQQGSPLTIILSHRYWVERYDADPGVLGQTVSIGGAPREIIGVMPEGFRLMDQDPAFYRPLRYDKATLTVSNFSNFGLGRLAEGVTIEEALPELNRLAYLAPERYPGMVTAELLESVGGRAVLTPLKDDLVGNVGNILWVRLGSGPWRFRPLWDRPGAGWWGSPSWRASCWRFSEGFWASVWPMSVWISSRPWDLGISPVSMRWAWIPE